MIRLHYGAGPGCAPARRVRTPVPMTQRAAIASARRVVLKLGTRVLTHDHGGLALARLFGVVELAAGLLAAGREPLIVSSGAVGLGRDALGLVGERLSLADRQACAAVGQSRLMALYDAGFSRLGLVTGQVLLTQGDFDDRERYLNLRSTLMAMLGRGVVPVINENDAVSTEELALLEGSSRQVFGDNDKLAALVAAKLDADLLVLLTDVDGVYDRDPSLPGASLIREVTDPASLSVSAGGSRSGAGRGGMRSKVEAAALAAGTGCEVVIASGRAPGALEAVLDGAPLGTWFHARPGMGARRRWIAHAAAARGALHLDVGAVTALQRRGASLLAAGVSRVEGDFRRGDVVELYGPDGARIGRGIVHCDAGEARRWSGGQPPAGARNHDALVHRDHLALEGS